MNEQNNKLIIMASEEYKAIEAEIYEYAAYLQCNQLASSLSYEPLSITCLTEDLDGQLKNVNKTLIQNEELSPKAKARVMRDFLLEWVDRFRKKVRLPRPRTTSRRKSSPSRPAASPPSSRR